MSQSEKIQNLMGWVRETERIKMGDGGILFSQHYKVEIIEKVRLEENEGIRPVLYRQKERMGTHIDIYGG